MAELLTAEAPVVVAHEGGRRRGLQLLPSEPPQGEGVPKLGPDGVVLLTGGEHEVIVRAALELARTSGCHIELMGRTQDIPDALEEHAASVRYHAGDARDAQAVRNVAENVQMAHRRLDGVIHTAGGEMPESLGDAYRAKVDSASALAQTVMPDVGFFAVLCGLAGVHDQGQAGDAAADDACGTLAHVWRRRLRGGCSSPTSGRTAWSIRTRRGGAAAGDRMRGRGARRADRRSPVNADREPIAIVGAGAVFPGAGSAAELWRNVLAGFDAISEVPPGRWDPALLRPGRLRARPGERPVLLPRGGFVDELATFDPARFGILPPAVRGMEPDQLLALRTAGDAIADAGGDERLPDRSRIGVVIGRGGYITPGVARYDQRVRTSHQVTGILAELMPDLGRERLAEIRRAFCERLGPDGADAPIGLVPSLAASRIAGTFDLHGPAYTLDAACASSLLAVEHAVRRCAAGRPTRCWPGPSTTRTTPRSGACSASCAR